MARTTPRSSTPWPLVALLATLCVPVQAVQEPIQTPQSIRAHVHRFLIEHAAAAHDGDDIEVSVNPLDARLRLSRCDQPLEAFLPPSRRASGRVSVGVRCAGGQPWSLYVPATVRQYAEVVVANRHVKRGARIQRADLNFERRDLNRLRRGYFRDPSQVAGMLADRPIRHGKAVTPGMLEKPLAVKRGNQVEIIAGIGGILARMKGKALGNAGLGERVRVKNLSSKKEIEARVISVGRVRVDI